MIWKFDTSNGRMTRDGHLVGTGYSGDEDHYNQPDAENMVDQGPIPRGTYTMSKFFDDPGGKGPLVCRLMPKEGTNTFGRSGFMMHGDNAQHSKTGSHGCIVLEHNVRAQVCASGETELEVVG